VYVAALNRSAAWAKVQPTRSERALATLELSSYTLTHPQIRVAGVDFIQHVRAPVLRPRFGRGVAAQRVAPRCLPRPH